MPAPLSLEEQLRRSVHMARAKRIQRMTETQSIVVHRDVSGPLEFSEDQVQLLRDGYAPGATPIEFRMLLEVARLRRLNPFLKQIHFVKRRSKDRNDNWIESWTSQVSIDGLRAIAQRTGLYDGQDEPEFERDKDGLILAAKVCVYRKDWSRPAVGVARWSEYVQTTRDGKPTKFWDTMPHVMIGKCAEALALRKAFPEDLAGVFTDEEMQQADNEQHRDNGTAGAFSPHLTPGELPNAAGDTDLFRSLCGRFSTLEADLETCDSYDKANALRAILGTRAQQSELTRTMQQKAESGDISPTQRQELGKTWMRCNRKLEALEKKLAPPVEATFEEPDGTEALGAPEREPGEDDDLP
jgi:phage recombination protein Bet